MKGDDRFQGRVSPLSVVVSLTLVALLAVAGGALTRAGGGGGRAVGWVLVGLAVVAGVATVRRARDRRPRVVIDAGGIAARAFGFADVVPWSAVERVGVFRSAGDNFRTATRLLTLHLRDPERYQSRVPAATQATLAFARRHAPDAAFGDLNIPFDGVSPGLDAAVAFITDTLGIPVGGDRP